MPWILVPAAQMPWISAIGLDEARKAWLELQIQQWVAAKAALCRFDFQYRDGFRYVGGFIGLDEARKAWLELQIQQWVAASPNNTLKRLTLAVHALVTPDTGD
jgi:predicted DNA-binding transcriptional regulator AlpA